MDERIASGSPPAQEQAATVGNEVTLWEAAAFILMRWRLALTTCVVIVTVGVAVILAFTAGRQYSATASFYAQGNRGSAGASVAGLAAQYGLMLPGPESTESPQFYAALLESDRLLREIVTTRFAASRGESDRELTLVEIFDIEPGSQAWEIEQAVKELRDRLNIRVDRQTGVVEFTVTAGNPTLAAGIARRIIDAVNEYNVLSRQSNAAAERRFVEDRLRDAVVQLDSTERNLAGFLSTNRQFESSPQLAFEYDRLQRSVLLKQQSVTSLSQALEQARIEEVRNLPVISVFEEPTTPVRPDRTGGVLLLMGLVIFATLAGLTAAFTVGLWDTRLSRGPNHAMFKRALDYVRNDLERTVGRTKSQDAP